MLRDLESKHQQKNEQRRQDLERRKKNEARNVSQARPHPERKGEEDHYFARQQDASAN
jgi:hypothetical protein